MTDQNNSQVQFEKNAKKEYRMGDYWPLKPKDIGIRTYEVTVGTYTLITARVTGTETVPYVTGDITGVKVSNFISGSEAGYIVFYLDGINVMILKDEEYILSSNSTRTPDIIVNTTSDEVDFIAAQQVGELPGLPG